MLNSSSESRSTIAKKPAIDRIKYPPHESLENFCFTFSNVSGATNHSISPQLPQTRKWTLREEKKPIGSNIETYPLRGTFFE
jgi:hypothetical protein